MSLLAGWNPFRHVLLTTMVDIQGGKPHCLDSLKTLAWFTSANLPNEVTCQSHNPERKCTVRFLLEKLDDAWLYRVEQGERCEKRGPVIPSCIAAHLTVGEERGRNDGGGREKEMGRRKFTFIKYL